MAKTAVLMATYNGERYIKEQLSSIANQTIKPDYVLIRDDCSTDNTVSIIETFIKNNNLADWKVTNNSVNKGWRRNFRDLIEDSRSLDVNYIFFSDQDDTWYLDKNERQIAIMESNQNIDVLSADMDIELLSQNATAPRLYPFDRSGQLSKYPDKIEFQAYSPGWTFCIRKSFSDIIIQYYDKNFEISHDGLLSSVAAFTGRGFNYNKSVGVHRRHEENASGHLLNISSPRSKHIYMLKSVLSYYIILSSYLKDMEIYDDKYYLAEKYKNFYQRRLENAQNKSYFSTLWQIITQGRYYDNFSNRMRDLVFLFKKDKIKSRSI